MKTLSCLFVLLLISYFLPAQIKVVADKTNSAIIYNMKHPMHDWEAKCKDVNAVAVFNSSTRSIEQVAVSVRVDAFDSGNANRDSHALEVLEALKYPKITFVSTKVVANGNKLLINGNLNFHNITKPITIEAIKKDGRDRVDVEGLFYVLLSNHQIERPSLVGIKCDDEVKVSFRVEFIDRPIK